MTEEDSTRQRKAFLLRLPQALHVELQGLAARELRSLNGQIEFLLREALRRRKKPDEPGDGDSVDGPER